MTVLFYVSAAYLLVCAVLCLHMLVHLVIGRRMRVLVGPYDRDSLRTTRPPFRPLIAAR